MPRNVIYYNQRNHSVIVGGAIVQDFAEGDAIGWEDVVPEAVSVTNGLDGSRLSFGSAKSGKITIKLKPTSPTIDYLNFLMEMQKNGIPLLQTVVIYTGVNTVVTLINAGVSRGKADTGAPTMAEREYTFTGETLMPEV